MTYNRKLYVGFCPNERFYFVLVQLKQVGNLKGCVACTTFRNAVPPGRKLPLINASTQFGYHFLTSVSLKS